MQLYCGLEGCELEDKTSRYWINWRTIVFLIEFVLEYRTMDGAVGDVQNTLRTLWLLKSNP